MVDHPRLPPVVGALIASALALAPSAHAHGTRIKPPKYQGPGDVVPAGPDDPVPPGPTGPSSPPSPGSGAPADRPSGGGTPSGPSGPGVTGPPANGAPTSAPGNPVTGALPPDATEWAWWWELHRHELIGLRATPYEEPVRTGSDDFFVGNAEILARDTLRPRDEDIAERVLPALVRALEGSDHHAVVTGCLVALAKIGRPGGAPASHDVVALVRPYLAHPSQEVAETAAISLAMLGDESVAPLLVALLHDDPNGRAAVDDTEVTERTRAFAAYGLGLLGHHSDKEDVRRFAVHHLVTALEEAGGESLDLPAACLTAIGLVPLALGPQESPSASRSGQLAFVADAARDERLPQRARAHAITAQARLVAVLPDRHPLRADVVGELVALLGATSKAPTVVRRACVLGLGLIGDGDGDELDASIREVLRTVDARMSDVGARNFALVALAETTARRGAGAGSDETRLRTVQYLLGQLDGASSQRRGWAALALGVLGRRLQGSSEGLRPPTLDALRRRAVDERTPVELSAYALAVGLARDAESGPVLVERMRATEDDSVRGYLALSVGLLGERRHLPSVQEVRVGALYRPELLIRCAVALGLLGDRAAAGSLLEDLRATGSLAAKAAIAEALGTIGDARSLDELVALLGDEDVSDAVRAFAAVALGRICDARELPWNTPFVQGLDYLSAPPTLVDLDGTGLLNIL